MSLFCLFNITRIISAQRIYYIDKEQHSPNAIDKAGLIHTGSGYSSTIATTQIAELSTLRTTVSTTEKTTSTTFRQVTTDSLSLSTTLVNTEDSTSTMSTPQEGLYVYRSYPC